MKNLIYKELKLSIHPMCYVFSSLFCMLFSLVPGVGTSVGFIYCVASFPFLLIGANKGRSTNDIYYTILLPIRKADVVRAKLFSFIFLEFISIVSVSIGSIGGYYINKAFPSQKQPFIGLGIDTFGILAGVALIGFGLTNLIIFILYFKNARSITAPTLISIFFLPLYMGLFGIGLPTLIKSTNENMWNKITSPVGQIILFFISLAIFIGLTILTYILSAKRFEKSDQ